MSAHERTGWRDEAISRRHRDWGFDCPAVDIDFLLIEYDKGEPVALVEYKEHNAEPLDLSHSSYKAMRRFADRAGVPFFVARYRKDTWEFLVTPVNDAAKEIYRMPEMHLTERRFVASLYYIRDRKAGGSVLQGRNNVVTSAETDVTA